MKWSGQLDLNRQQIAVLLLLFGKDLYSTLDMIARNGG